MEVREAPGAPLWPVPAAAFQTVIMGLMIGMFPIMVMAAMFNMMTLQVLKGYVFALIWLQTWPLLFAILNVQDGEQ